ncbi:outer membrane beta-barrel protein [Rhizosphaericola mali]|uniref:PorT family protein n=1 Tax=Rhizosphaericola mali TaxID=2545455 RepID=A0A5P2G2J7_9BACT|nr:outer membrane beta-barrel protein [Rhizosphaericola mali]QES88030.1 PorT family protein [Rhizosphaericola mali]
MKYYFIAGTLFLFVLGGSINMALAQEKGKRYLGIKGGLSIPNLSAGGSAQTELNTGYSSATGTDFAIFYEVKHSSRLSFSTQLEYCTEGGKKNGFQALPTPDALAPYFTGQQRAVPSLVYADYNCKAKMNYLLLSEMAKYRLPLAKSSPLSFYAEAGPFVGLLLSAHQVTSGQSNIYADKTQQENITEISGAGEQSLENDQNIRNQLHKFNFGIEGDIGFAYTIRRSKIFIEGGGNYGFLNIQKGTANGKNRIGAGIVRMGYALEL